MDTDRLHTVLDALPRGGWASYADVAVAAGGTLLHARALNQRLIRMGHPHGHRVLRSDGTIAPTALGDPDAVRRKLRREGVRLTGGRAPAEARVRPAEAATVA